MVVYAQKTKKKMAPSRIDCCVNNREADEGIVVEVAATPLMVAEAMASLLSQSRKSHLSFITLSDEA